MRPYELPTVRASLPSLTLHDAYGGVMNDAPPLPETRTRLLVLHEACRFMAAPPIRTSLHSFAASPPRRFSGVFQSVPSYSTCFHALTLATTLCRLAPTQHDTNIVCGCEYFLPYALAGARSVRGLRIEATLTHPLSPSLPLRGEGGGDDRGERKNCVRSVSCHNGSRER